MTGKAADYTTELKHNWKKNWGSHLTTNNPETVYTAQVHQTAEASHSLEAFNEKKRSAGYESTCNSRKKKYDKYHNIVLFGVICVKLDVGIV